MAVKHAHIKHQWSCSNVNYESLWREFTQLFWPAYIGQFNTKSWQGSEAMKQAGRCLRNDFKRTYNVCILYQVIGDDVVIASSSYDTSRYYFTTRIEMSLMPGINARLALMPTCLQRVLQVGFLQHANRPSVVLARRFNICCLWQWQNHNFSAELPFRCLHKSYHIHCLNYAQCWMHVFSLCSLSPIATLLYSV